MKTTKTGEDRSGQGTVRVTLQSQGRDQSVSQSVRACKGQLWNQSGESGGKYGS